MAKLLLFLIAGLAALYGGLRTLQWTKPLLRELAPAPTKKSNGQSCFDNCQQMAIVEREKGDLLALCRARCAAKADGSTAQRAGHDEPAQQKSAEPPRPPITGVSRAPADHRPVPLPDGTAPRRIERSRREIPWER